MLTILTVGYAINLLLSIHPLTHPTTPSNPNPSIHPIKPPCQLILSIHPVNPPYQPTLSIVGDIKKTTDADGNPGPDVSCWANKWQDTDNTVNIDQPPDPSLLESDYWPSTTDRYTHIFLKNTTTVMLFLTN